ncbi:hypothetical protein TNCV_439691 [Trichonephila clavipes]|nr:hypothetical protein TNCV_439691 [Trichonephila clavipes]
MGRSHCQNERRLHQSKKVFNAQSISTRRKGKPNLRYINGLEKDLLVLRTKNSRTFNRKKAGLEKTSREGEGPPWAVEPLGKEGYIHMHLQKNLS